MFIYLLRSDRSSRTGTAIKEVVCEKCQCGYHYRMARRGLGAVSSFRLFGARAGRNNADRAAQKHLERLLRKGIDPVACPDCGWFQAPMVREIYRRRDRWMDAVGLTALGLALLVAGGYWLTLDKFTYHRPYTTSEIQSLASIAGTGLAIAIGLIGLRRFLRYVNNPNRAYPARPAPIPGVPAAFKVDGAGATEVVLIEEPSAVDSNALAYERRPLAVGSAGWVTVQLLQIRFPALCCCCLQPTDSIKEYAVHHSWPANAPVRICRGCATAALWKKILTVVIAGLVIGLSAGCGLWVAAGSKMTKEVFLLISVPMGGLGMLLGLGISRLIADPLRFGGFSPKLNTVRIRFRNREYTIPFADMNPVA